MTLIVLLASLTTLIYAASYTLRCVVSPWGRCRRCHGQRSHRTAIGTRRDCTRCDGTGIRVRVGRRLAEHVISEYRAGQR